MSRERKNVARAASAQIGLSLSWSRERSSYLRSSGTAQQLAARVVAATFPIDDNVGVGW